MKFLLFTLLVVSSLSVFAESETGATGGGGHGGAKILGSESGAVGGGGHGSAQAGAMKATTAGSASGCNCTTGPGPYGNDTTTSGGGYIAGALAGIGSGTKADVKSGGKSFTCVKEGDTLHCQDGDYYKTGAVNTLDRKVEEKPGKVSTGQKTMSGAASGR